MPPRTSITEVLLFFGLVVIVGLVHWLVRFYMGTEASVKALGEIPENDNKAVSVQQKQEAIRLFHRGFTNLTITLMPLIGFWLSQTFVSIARDAGYIIFPWFILASVLTLTSLSYLSESLRKQLIRSKIARIENQLAEPN